MLYPKGLKILLCQFIHDEWETCKLHQNQGINFIIVFSTTDVKTNKSKIKVCIRKWYEPAS